jgi:hypothetical protein
MTMRPLVESLVLAALAAALVGCGSGTDPSGGRASDQPDVVVVALVSQTAGGGQVSAKPVRLDRPAAVTRFTGQFRGHALRTKVAGAVRRASPPDGRVLLGAVVAIGCDAPPGVRVEGTGSDLRILAKPVPSPLQECLAPVTTVAVVSVPADAA